MPILLLLPFDLLLFSTFYVFFRYGKLCLLSGGGLFCVYVCKYFFFHSLSLSLSLIHFSIYKIISNRLGFISLDEFAEACDLLQKHLPEHDTKEELMEMCKLMDINKDSLVDLNEFLETFRLCEQERGNSYRSEVLAVHFDLPNEITTKNEATNGDKNTATIANGDSMAAATTNGVSSNGGGSVDN